MHLTIILESNYVAAWIAHALQEIKRLEKISLSLIIIDGSERKTNFAFRFFKKLDRALLPGEFDYTKTVVSEDLEKGFHCLKIDEIAYSDTDLIINFTPSELPVKQSVLSKHGTWSINIGEANAGGFWEWFYQNPVTTISIYQSDKKEILHQTVTKTEYLSYSRNETSVFAKAIDFLVESIRKLSLTSNLKSDEKIVTDQNLAEPGLIASISACVKLCYRLTEKTLFKIFFIEQWVLYVSGEPQNLPTLNFKQFKALTPSKDRIWADPFVITQADKHFIFIEEMPLNTRRGHLRCLVLNQNGEILESRKIIKQPYHLSYPFVFQHEETWFMIPESGENKTIDLYECTDFPFQWTLRKNLIKNAQAYDATLHVQDGLFWLFCTIQNQVGGSPNNDLHVFYAENLFGDWSPHKLNPVISDPYTARPAGRIFLKDGVLYRPSQICVPRYGYGLSFNKIVSLTKDEYQEEQVSKMLPDWDQKLLATHTLNFSENFTVIDALVKRSRFF